MSAAQKTAVSILNELAIRLKLDIPGQELQVPEKESSKTGHNSPLFMYEYEWNGYTARGEGTSKKRAQHKAAAIMFNILRKIPEFAYAFPPDNIQLISSSDLSVEKDAVGPLTNYVYEYMLPTPTFQNVREEGPAHDRRFTSRCSIPCYAVEAFDRQKKQAKQQVALQMLTKLKNTIEPQVNREIKTSPADAHVDDFEEALKKFPHCQRLFNTKYHPGDLSQPIFDAFTRYQDYHEIVFEALDEFASLEKESPEEMLDSILEKIGVNYALVPVPAESDEDCIVALNIHFAPDLNICEIGASYVEASRMAAFKAISSLRILCSSPKKNSRSQVENDERNLPGNSSAENQNSTNNLEE